MPRVAAVLLMFVGLGAFSVACGGGNDATPTPAPTTPPTAGFQSPCPASVTASASSTEASGAAVTKLPGGLRDPDPRGTFFDVMWRHRAAVDGGLLTPPAAIGPRATVDVGEVAVIQDEGDLITTRNPFDVPLTGLRFAPNTEGGYNITRIDASFRADIGPRVTLGDDDSIQRSVPFGFTYFGRPQTMAFVNSDGNITFGEGDNSSSDRNIARLLTGAPRVAPFLSDLDPSTGGGVFVRAAADAFTVTWCGVPAFGSTQQLTMQTSLLPDGTVEMEYPDPPRFTTTDGIVGISPGRTGTFRAVDLSTATAGTPIAGGAAAVGERFANQPDLDLVSVARKFYRTHPDSYDQLVIWTDTRLTVNAFSFEVTVANEISGIGVRRFDASAEFGSGGRLRSLVQMDAITKFPDDPTTKFLGENNTLSVLGQEVGHRWLAFLQFSDVNRQVSNALLGRDNAHWSFFFNSDASVMEGNRIQDLGGGSFRTVAAVEKYSLLDQYAMGLVRDIDVPPFFYVDTPANSQPSSRAESAPRVGVTFNGTRREVLINDVIEALGPRQPSADQSAKVHRQAFLFVVGNGRTSDPQVVAKIDRIRRAWEAFFNQATDGRGRAETRLFPTS